MARVLKCAETNVIVTFASIILKVLTHDGCEKSIDLMICKCRGECKTAGPLTMVVTQHEAQRTHEV